MIGKSSPNFSPALWKKAQFDGGRITSDGSGLLLREVEQRTEVIRQFADCFTSIDILRDFKKPVVVSFISYPGLPTMDMEKSVTSRVEWALTLAGGIEHQESRTVPGASVIKIFFQPGTDPSAAMNDIVNLEASDMFHLPPGIEWPFTLRSEPANLPVVLAAIAGEGLSETELYKNGYYAVRNKMGGLKGVQIPHPFGGKFRQMMVYVDPSKLYG